jgi:hypothetical protein
MTRTQIICLANSSKHGERCLAGINPSTAKWVRPVSLAYPNDGRVPWSTPVIDGTELLTLADVKSLDILEIPLHTTGPDFGFECENFAILDGEWAMVGKARVDDIVPYVNFYGPVLHDTRKYVSVSNLQMKPFENRRSLELVYADKLDITRHEREGGGTKWKGSFTTRGGYSLNNITITDPELFDLLGNDILPEGPCLITMSLGMPFEPPGWNGPAQPCWKLIAGVMQLSLADQIFIEMYLAGWTVEDGRSYAISTYGKKSRSQMSDDEQQDFIDHLRHIRQANQPQNFSQLKNIPQMIPISQRV